MSCSLPTLLPPHRPHAWLIVTGEDWHVFSSDVPLTLLSAAFARPARDSSEPDGWHWQLEIGAWTLPLPAGRIVGPRPELPRGYIGRERRLVLYRLPHACMTMPVDAEGHQSAPTMAGVQQTANVPLMILRAPGA